MQCQLCDRPGDRLTLHHLVPRQVTKRKQIDTSPTVEICAACHRQIHTLFDNKVLAQELNSIDALKQNPSMQRFLRWVQKQDPNRKISVDRKRG
ncbi:HNH endonuclease [Microcoleus sp. FACHB-1515]|uniref:HNH endonuclease n=1 Tax=Cyanophyceae TaxID=3028117 RepID=UPI0016873E1B|nr:HNH endonuclease [Microcoleus sp. FACHB-1515]MBD2088465.1 HNH endonuclease [Microcoleus sp. FACHB-1515]